MADGKVGLEKSTVAQSLDNSDEQREANSLPEDGAASTSRDAAGVDGNVQRLNPATGPRNRDFKGTSENRFQAPLEHV
ncbi:hypothetical protein MTO96_012233 [Rhipicephalus appendiculatus]